jgi:hypothetical protein
MRTKTFIGKIFSQMSMYVAYLPLTIFFDIQPVTIGSCIVLHQVVIRSTKVRHMNLFLYIKSVLTYKSHT